MKKEIESAAGEGFFFILCLLEGFPAFSFLQSKIIFIDSAGKAA